MRPPSDMPSPRPSRARRRFRSPGRGRTLLIVAAVALFVLITSLRGIASFYTDYLWFDSLGYDGVFTGVVGAKVALAVIFVLAFFALCWLNLYIADRLAPQFPVDGQEQEVIDRFQEVIGHRTGLFRAAVAGVFALIAGVNASQEWESWLLFVNGGDFDVEDPLFSTDVGFYVFRLPFLTFVTDWAFAAILIILVVTAAAHYFNGGIRAQAPGPRVTPQVKAHISVLLGVLALVRAAGYYLQRFELTTSTRGVVDGATATDVAVQLPALNLLILISVTSFALFVGNIWRRGWTLPVLGVGLWALVAVVAGGIIPQFWQQFRVEPNESAREEPYIEDNIEATQAALGLDEIETVPYDPNSDPANVDLSDDQDTIRNIRLWDPSRQILGQTYRELQRIRPYYKIEDVDVDRYMVDGALTQVMLSVRDLNTDGVPNSTWENNHLTYTHGHGVVAASANAKQENGRPVFYVNDVPARSSVDTLELTQPAVYFGEDLNGYVITGTTRRELDVDVGAETQFVTYAGEDGVGIGSLFRKVAFALRFGDYNPIISNFLTDESRIHYIRDVRERAEQLAPFLEFDADPYPVVHEGRIVWILDAYTTSARYPYGQRADNDQISSDSGLNQRFNYVRNSVKGVVDAYDGTVNFYVIDPEDPIIQAWRDAFPNLFSDFAEMPEALKDHLRYPEDLFRVQTNQWERYHQEDPDDFYDNDDGWSVSGDPNTSGQSATVSSIDAQGVTTTRRTKIDPYYVLAELPGEEELEFFMLRPFAPIREDGATDNPLLTAIMVARSSQDGYGQLEVLELPPGNLPDGPTAVNATIQNDEDASSLETLLGGSGSTVLSGNLIVVPVDNSLLYVRPFYVQAEATPIPELERVIAVFEGRVAVENTLQEALGELFRQQVDTDEIVPDLEDPDPGVDPGEVPEETENEQIQRLLQEASDLFTQADEALAQGDLGEYQSLVDRARERLEEAEGLLSPAPTTTVPADDPQEA